MNRFGLFKSNGNFKLAPREGGVLRLAGVPPSLDKEAAAWLNDAIELAQSIEFSCSSDAATRDGSGKSQQLCPSKLWQSHRGLFPERTRAARLLLEAVAAVYERFFAARATILVGCYTRGAGGKDSVMRS